MTSTTTTTAAAAADYSPAAFARLAMSAAARELADTARAWVPTSSDSYGRAGGWAEAAAGIAADARDLLALAVVYERLRGTTWEEIGEALGGITRQAAQDRYGAYVTEWKTRALRAWLSPAERMRLLGDLPHDMVRRLNAWVDRHRELADVDSGPDPVGAGLAALTTLSMSGLLIEGADLLHKARTATAADELAALELGYARRKVQLAERLVAEGQRDAEQMLAEARARLAELETAGDQEAAGPAEPTVTVYCGHCGGGLPVPARVFDPDRDRADLFITDCPHCRKPLQVNG